MSYSLKEKREKAVQNNTKLDKNKYTYSNDSNKCSNTVSGRKNTLKMAKQNCYCPS